MVSKRNPGEMTVVNDLINAFDESLVTKYVWGAALLRYLNKHIGGDTHFSLNVTMKEVSVEVLKLDQRIQFELLSRPIEENDEYTGEIWRAMESSQQHRVSQVEKHNVRLSNILLIMFSIFLFGFTVWLSIKVVHGGVDVGELLSWFLTLLSSN